MKKTALFVSAIVLSAGVFTTLAQVNAQTPDKSSSKSSEIIVKYKSGATSSKISALNESMNAKVTGGSEGLDFKTVEVKGSAKDAIKKFEKDSNVAYAEKKITFKATADPNDTDFSKQYGPQTIKAPEAWETTKGKKDVKVAVVDTGVDYTHPDLKDKVEKGGDYINNDKDPKDDQGHGTHCAGVIGAVTNNNEGIAGVAPDVTIYAVKVLDENGSGDNETVAKGIKDAADAGSSVISLSLGSPENSKVVEDAVNYAADKGSVVVAAAGNDGSKDPGYPGANEKAIAVGATDKSDKKAEFSNYGSDWVDVAAPGVDILSTVPGGKYEEMSGTSMATPHVAGVAGLVASTGKKGDEVRKAIESSADKVDGTGSDWKYGRVNAANAVKK
ncbi:thermitase [Marininema mesophilum]|uniref:Thermitase n=1 Tax=Marininema mesophilum TaxID=1048340 RepID=A0A1H2X317_9BACL|nr:S8 family peptidase [Marininema mesophilum]SDW86894.1 thermitase [Marininema mesophilum]